MNRGHDGTDIFYGNKNKSQFIDYLAEATTKLKIKIFAYCVMDTHYHLVLENSNGSKGSKSIGDWGLKIMIDNKETFA